MTDTPDGVDYKHSIFGQKMLVVRACPKRVQPQKEAEYPISNKEFPMTKARER